MAESLSSEQCPQLSPIIHTRRKDPTAQRSEPYNTMTRGGTTNSSSDSEDESEDDLDFEVRFSRTRRASGKDKKLSSVPAKKPAPPRRRAAAGSSSDDDDGNDNDDDSEDTSVASSGSSSSSEDSYVEDAKPASKRRKTATPKSSSQQATTKRTATTSTNKAASTKKKPSLSSKPLGRATVNEKKAVKVASKATVQSKAKPLVKKPAKAAASKDPSSSDDNLDDPAVDFAGHDSKPSAVPSPRKKKTTKAPRMSSSSLAEPLPTELDVILPHPLSRSSGECCILVQIDPDDAAALDLEGATGAVGRIETDDDGGTQANRKTIVPTCGSNDVAFPNPSLTSIPIFVRNTVHRSHPRSEGESVPRDALPVCHRIGTIVGSQKEWRIWG